MKDETSRRRDSREGERKKKLDETQSHHRHKNAKYIAAHVARTRDKQIEKKWTGDATSFNIIRHTQIHTHTQRERDGENNDDTRYY
jgi:hypothetical protein